MKTLETAPATLPEHSLGDHVAAWMEHWLMSPADPNKPLRLTREQIRFLIHWYAITDEGRWVWRRGMLRRPKGWGKDPLSACIGLAELLGPTRFSHWEDGYAVGKPAHEALVQVGAVSEAQTRTTTSVLDTVISERLREKHDLTVRAMSTKGTVNGRPVTMNPITSSARSAEGARVTAFISNEVQHWLRQNGGWDMSKVIRRNLTKSPDGSARELSITNAHEPGESSVAEMDDDGWRKMRKAGGFCDILLDTREPILPTSFALTDIDLLREALTIAYGDSYWLDLDRIIAEIQDPRTTESEAHRFYLNRLVAGTSKWMNPSDLDRAWRDWAVPAAGSPIAVGFDGSRTRDATAIVCTDMISGFQWVAGVWESDHSGEWEVPEAEVNGVMDRIFDTWRVSRLYCDPAYWEEALANWAKKWPDQVAAWWIAGSTLLRTARSVTAFKEAMIREEIPWGGIAHPAYRRHMLHAVARPYQADVDEGRLHSIGKTSKTSTSNIDIAVAAVMSWQAKLDAIAAGWKPPVQFKVRRRPNA